MAKTLGGKCRRYPILYYRFNNVWLHKWSQVSNSSSLGSNLDLKKAIKYYPKGLLALQAIVKNIGKQHMQKLLLKRFLSKYKKDFFRNIIIHCNDISLFPSLEKLGSKITRLKTGKNCQISKSDDFALKKLIAQNKHLTIFEQGSSGPFTLTTVKSLKYLTNISSIYLTGILYCSKQFYKRLLFASAHSLKSVTWTEFPNIMRTEGLEQLFEIIFQLPKLARFNCDLSGSEIFDIDRISFHILDQRKISYDIRISHHFQTFSFSKANITALENLQFLGINLKHKWKYQSFVWDLIQEEHIKTQKGSQKSLFLNLLETKHIVFTDLFKACKNISVLDLIISQEKGNAVYNFSSLKYLRNLKKIFIQFSDIDAFKGSFCEHFFGLFKNNNSLCFVSLEFNKCDRESGLFLISLLALCQNKLQLEKIILKFDSKLAKKVVNKIFNEINKLKQLKSLAFISSLSLGKGNPLKKKLKGNESLEELHIQIVKDEKKLFEFSPPKNLLKLSITIGLSSVCDDFLKSLEEIKNLRHLEVEAVHIDKDSWKCIRQFLLRPSNLKTVKLGDFISDEMEVLMNDVNFLMRNHGSLNLIVVKCESENKVFVFKQKNYSFDIDSYLWRGNQGTPISKKLEIKEF